MRFALLFFLSFFVFYYSNKGKPSKIENDYNICDYFIKKAENKKLSYGSRCSYNGQAFKLLGKMSNSIEKRNRINSIIFNSIAINDWKNSKKYSQYALVLATEKKDKKNSANATYLLGYSYMHLSINDSAFYYLNKAIGLTKKNGNYRGLSTCYLSMAELQYFCCDYLSAEKCAIAGINYAKKVKCSENEIEGLNWIAFTSNELGYYKKSNEYHNKVLSLITDDSYYQKAATLSNQGYNYFKLGDHEKALEFYEKALNVIKKNPEFAPKVYARILDHMARIRCLKKDYSSSPNFYLQSDSIRNVYGIEDGKNYNKLYLSEYYAAIKDTLKAKQLALEALRLSKNFKAPNDQLEMLKQLLKIDPQNYRKYSNQYVQLSDSLQLAERRNRDKFARIAFETDQIVIEKNQAVKQKWIISISAAALLLFMTLLFIIKMQRAKQKELLLLQVQQKSDESIYQLINDQQIMINHGRQTEKKRIARELHDGVMNKLTSTRLNLFVLNKKKDDETIEKCIGLIDGIQEIEKEIRQVAHDLDNDLFSGNKSYNLLLEALFDEFRSVSTAKIFDEIDPEINWEKTETALRMNVYRILQESLQNANKYAQAKNIFVTIKKQETDLRLIIHDDGIGFNLQKAKKGIGLKNIAQRIKSLNGEIIIKTEKGQGALINIRLPLQH